MKKNTLSLICLLIFTISLCGCFGLFGDAELVEGSTTLRVEDNTSWDMGYTAYVRGQIKNTSSTTYDYVSVTYSLYDNNGNLIGTALDNMNYLGPGEVWSFEAFSFYLDRRPVKAKLKDITCY